jgi:hypothetical protein
MELLGDQALRLAKNAAMPRRKEGWHRPTPAVLIWINGLGAIRNARVRIRWRGMGADAVPMRRVDFRILRRFVAGRIVGAIRGRSGGRVLTAPPLGARDRRRPDGCRP